MLRFNMEQDEKITIRISRDILEDIDEFLERNPTLGNRSEFLRNLAVEYIAKSRSNVQVQTPEVVCVQIPGAIREPLSESVDLGFFNNLSEALTVVINELAAGGQLFNILIKRLESARQAKENFMNYRRNMESMGDVKVERTEKK